MCVCVLCCVLEVDHSRVKLGGMDDTDYINANYVECKLARRKYILAQAPLKHTCEHFWQMIWEQNTRGVVMLNKLYEKGIVCVLFVSTSVALATTYATSLMFAFAYICMYIQPKCEMYYPNVDEENSEMVVEFGKFRLNYLSEKPFEDFSIRVIECENVQVIDSVFCICCCSSLNVNNKTAKRDATHSSLPLYELARLWRAGLAALVPPLSQRVQQTRSVQWRTLRTGRGALLGGRRSFGHLHPHRLHDPARIYIYILQFSIY